jgi:GT2 family glycosyltransferase
MIASLVVVAYHRPASLAALLDGLVGAEVDVVVANVDEDPEVRAVAQAAGARHVGVPGNPGFGTAVNLGASRAIGEVVVFANDDLRIDPGSLEHLAQAVTSGRCDVAVPQVRDATGAVERTIHPLVTPSSLLVEWLVLPDRPLRALRRLPIEKWRTPLVEEPVRAATGAAVAVRADLLQQVAMPEHYFLYWEELDWFWHLRDAGARVSYLPQAQVHHHGGRDDVRAEKSALMARNAVRCVRSTQGRRSAALAWPVVVAWNLRLVVAEAARSARTGRSSERIGARRAGLVAAIGAWREVR